ncbi:MAG: M56 family metallopeptidase [Burkholderiales bacterium]|nr:M56 family metallopeptidase [Burkholderiales bacterium]MBI3731081.1 M56 family metallopeptidase [Burkholderiales bacterium]
MSQFFQQAVNALGWALLHFVWQGLLTALLLAVVLNFIGSAQARARYATAYIALIACICLPVREFFMRMSEKYTSNDGSALSEIPIQLGLDSSPVWIDFSVWLEMHLSDVVMVWMICVAVLVMRMCIGLLWIAVYTHPKRSKPNLFWQTRINQMSQQFHIRSRVIFRVVDDLSGPVTVGVVRPMILLPGAMLTGMPVDLLEMLVAHEMGHIKRHDYLLNLIQTAIETLLFYHPAVWWISKQIRIEREEIADEIAARVTGEPRRLALALSELANFQFTTPQLAQAAHGGNLMSRIKRLVKSEVRTVNWKATFLILGLVSSSLTLFAHANVSSANATKETGTAKDTSAAKQLYRDDEKKGDKKPVIDFAQCRPMYPRESLNKKETGRVQLAVLIGADGEILNAKVERSTGHRMLDNAVVDALKTCKEKAIPGKINGEYAQIWTKVQFVWKLE